MAVVKFKKIKKLLMTFIDLSTHGKIIFFQFLKEVKGNEKLFED